MDRKATPAHEYAEIFPMHEGTLSELAERIKEHGQREAIVMLDGKILDGRRREAACIRVGVEPKYRKFGSRGEDGDDPLEFVIDTNLHRRQLTKGESELAAGKYAIAKVGGDRIRPSHQLGEVVQTRKIAAEKFGTSTSQVDRAKIVVTHGVPELQEAVASGKVTTSDAANVAKEEPSVQRQALKTFEEGKSKSLAGAVDQKSKPPASRSKVAAADGISGRLASLRREVAAYSKKAGTGKHYAECVAHLDAFQSSYNRWKLQA